MNMKWNLDQQLPKRMSTKKAEKWLEEHPEVHPALFWGDQSDKHRAASLTAMKWTVIFLAISLIFQILAIVIRFNG